MLHPEPVALATPQNAARVARPHWYKDAIIYQLHVKAFFDSDDDGIGDFPGLTQKLDYIRDLGVNTIWLLPFYPSPLRDDGYDVADYRNVNPSYGTRADFHEFVREAHKRGLRIVTELIVNHTSDQHPWFQAARRAPPGSSKRAFYVWSDTPDRYAGTRIIFTDTEKSNWAWDDVAKAYYWHRFFSHQPDLNFDHPRVVKAVLKTMQFWLDMGVDGLRLDAIPYLVEREGTSNENLPETHAVLKRIRAQVDASHPEVLLLAEANQWPEDVREYFGNGDECHMAYHFPLMPRMYMAIAQEERHPITEIMSQTPDIPESCQWAIFLRNHDELTLEMVTSRERDYMYTMYAADKRARINLGIRRRLAPLLENDLGRIKLMKSLLLSMPGSPILYYGDELGMGDNIYLGDRDGVRTPMQWSPERNAGFSRADPQRLFLQPIMDPVYGYPAVNVEAQAREPNSLLNWTKRMLVVRKGVAAFGRGTLRFLHPANRKILAYLREFEDEIVLCVANLARSAQPVELDLARHKGRIPLELFGRTPFPPIGELPYLLTLAGHGFLWFRLVAASDIPSHPLEVRPRDELPVLVLFDGWSSFFRDSVVPWRIGLADKVRSQLEHEVLPPFVAERRWFGAKGESIARVEIADQIEWKPDDRSYLLALARVETQSGTSQTYSLPLTLAWEDRDDERIRALAGQTIAKVRHRADVGVLADAFGDEAFCQALVAGIAQGARVKAARGEFRFSPTTAFATLAGAGPLKVGIPAARSSNTIVTYGERLFLKAYRRLQVGVNPEVEIGRFLTEVARFPHTVPVAGSIDYVADDGRTAAVALLQGFVANQGNAWDFTLGYLDRHLDDNATKVPQENVAADHHGSYVALARTLGARTAELHRAFAGAAGDAAFAPEPLTAADVAASVEQLHASMSEALARLARRTRDLPEAVRAIAAEVLSRRDELLRSVDRHAGDRTAGTRTRLHGDYHLGQVLVVRNDFVITDFEGEPARSLDERRAKHSPFKDVAGMLRSFDYAMHTAVETYVAERSHLRATVARLARRWRAEAEQSFIGGYDEAAARAGLPTCAAEGKRLLELFLLEKAAYEMSYEMDNRPDWLAIPLRGLLETLAR